jgi:hypothetical protein
MRARQEFRLHLERLCRPGGDAGLKSFAAPPSHHAGELCGRDRPDPARCEFLAKDLSRIDIDLGGYS